MVPGRYFTWPPHTQGDFIILRRTLAIVLVLGVSSSAVAHEPVFSLGPETIWEGGVGIETKFEFEDARGDQLSALHYEIIYGVTSDLSLTFELPQILELQEDGETEHGLGDIEFRAKYQFFKKDLLGAQHKVSGIFGVKAPTGDDDAVPALSTGTTDFLLGVSYGYESRSWYQFLTVRYRLRTERGDLDPGDRLFIDAAIGFRPWQREYTEWDLVALLEMNVELEFDSEFRSTTLPNVGGNTVWLGPTILFSPNPQWMFKGGVQLSVYEDLNGDQEHSEFRAVFAIEFHF